MNRYFIYLSYNGKNYCGWQIQPNGISIQEVLEKALSVLLRQPVQVTGAGRTDAGVHARMMVAHFDADISACALSQLTNKLNAFLPKDIAIYEIKQVKNNMHARFDAISRLYRYYIITEKNPFKTETYYRYYGSPDIERMNACAKVLFEYKDFTSFSKLHTDVRTNNCIIMQAYWEKSGSEYVFTIQADRFLRNMVRAIVGTLLEAGRGRIDENSMRGIIEAKDRNAAGTSVPGNALFLEEINYPENIFV